MHYEASGRATPRRRWPILVPPLLAVALVAAALAGRAGESSPADQDANPGADRPEATAALVRWIECGGLPNADCGAAVAAARHALDDSFPAVHTATVSPSLICGDDLECPHWFLRRSRSVGSVVLTFVDSPLEAWVNVVEPDVAADPADHAGADPGTDADQRDGGPAPRFLGRLVRAFERS